MYVLPIILAAAMAFLCTNTVAASSQEILFSCVRDGGGRRSVQRDATWISIVDDAMALCREGGRPALLLEEDGAQVQALEELEDPLQSLLVHPTSALQPGGLPQRTHPRCRGRPAFVGSMFRGEQWDVSRAFSGRCAVVGSSGARPKRYYGPEIDAHDVVIRLNENPSAAEGEGQAHPIEALVGRKTTLRIGAVINPKNQKAIMSNSSARDHAVLRYVWPWLPNLEARALCSEGDMPCNTFSQAFLEYTAGVISPGAVLGNKARVGHDGQLKTLKPSTGFLAVLSAMYLCDSVDLYGFQLCTEHDAAATPICWSGSQVDAQPTKYFCKYYKYGEGWRRDRCSR